jgi:hypothetical protein
LDEWEVIQMGCGCGSWERRTRRTLEDGKEGAGVMDELVARIEGEGRIEEEGRMRR